MADRFATLQVSKDGAHNWGDPTQHSLGEVGAYQTRVVRRRLGVGRHWVLRLSVSSPMPRVLISMSIQDDRES